MKASVLDLRRHMREILRALDLNQTITLTYRGKEKAKIIPSPQKEVDSSIMDHPAFGLWKNRPDQQDVPELVRHMRKGRMGAV